MAGGPGFGWCRSRAEPRRACVASFSPSRSLRPTKARCFFEDRGKLGDGPRISIMRESFTPGQVVARRYQLEALLGEGGMGAVWRAHDLNLGSTVALKLLDEEYADSSEARARFEREARAAAALRSSHVVQIIEYGIHGDRFPYIAMELLEGETLAERLERVPGGALVPADVARILTHVGRAVGKAHENGIIHRDLKPENIFLVKND